MSASTTKITRRSIAWLYYAILTILAVLGAFSNPVMLIVAAPCALYSRYLYRGGRFVVWFW
jgi:hypothetical protein